MNIFFPIGAFYPSQVGGPCNTLYWHTCELTKKGIDVGIITTSRGIKEGTVTQDEFIPKECGEVYYGRGNTTSLSMVKEAAKSIKKADIIHLNSLFHGLAIFSFFYARLWYPKKKIVWSVRGELNPGALKFSRWKKVLILFLYRRLVGNVVFHSTSAQETIDIKAQFNDTKILQIPNFIRSYRRLQVPTKEQLLFMGRVHPIKALDKLIEGLVYSQKFLHSDFVVIIHGDYERRHHKYYLKLTDLIKKHSLERKVQFKGHIKGEAKQRAYAESHVLILPSETENFGNVVGEALNQGTPAIASKGTPWEMLDQKKCGFHIDNSPKEIANAIDRVIGMDKEEYLLYRENAKKLMDESFDVSRMIGVWVEAYRKLVAS